MIEVLSAAVVVLAAATAVNLLLLFAVVRRLRDRPAEPTADRGVPGIGTPVGMFAATDLAGEPVEVGTSPLLAGFVSATCEPCQTVTRQLLERGAQPIPQLLFVVGASTDPDTRDFAERLSVVARVAIVDHGDPVTEAFGGISAFPTLLRIEDGVVAAAGNGLAEVAPEPASAR